MPFTSSWSESLFTNVVLPEEEGPATQTTLISPRRAAIRSASSAIFFSCCPSAIWMTCLIRSARQRSFRSGTLPTPIRSFQLFVSV